MKMKQFLILILLIFFISCDSYVQVFETNTNNLNLKKDNNYIFENDSVRITYNFWADKGTMSFAVFNKLKKPLYIDWKKSSFISNTIKINYWADEINTNSVDERRTIIEGKKYNNGLNIKQYYVAKAIGISSTSSFKPERITFIPPYSNYLRTQFYLLPLKELKVKKYSTKEVTSLKDNSKKDIVLEKTLQEKETPLTFRNFITMSYSEDFNSEFYIDNEFYVSKVIKLEYSQFEAILRKENSVFFETDENGNKQYFNPYKNETSFYLKLIK